VHHFFMNPDPTRRRLGALAAGPAAMLALVLLLGTFSASAAAAALSTPKTYVKVYANILTKTQYGLTPEEVQATSDSGSIALAQTQTSKGVGMTWLLRLDSSGSPQWQKELGCFNGAPGDYALGVSVQQTADGGYVIGGGTIDCGLDLTLPWTNSAAPKTASRGARSRWLSGSLAALLLGRGVAEVKPPGCALDESEQPPTRPPRARSATKAATSEPAE
jgi:hypothetical protein